MPSPTEILDALTEIANTWRSLAVAWHLLLLGFVGTLLLRHRPSERTAACLLVLPMASVSVLAWTAGNPFNAGMFGIAALVLVAVAVHFSREPVRFALRTFVVVGAVLIVCGSIYPDFVETSSWIAYLYAAPFGLIPCPTLMVVIGFTLVFDLSRSRYWSPTLIVLGLAYGAVGVFRLDVVLDAVLVAGTIALAVATLRSMQWRSVRARPVERVQSAGRR